MCVLFVCLWHVLCLMLAEESVAAETLYVLCNGIREAYLYFELPFRIIMEII